MCSKSFFSRCKKSGINFDSFVNCSKSFVLVHRYLDSGHNSIVAFSDSYSELESVASCHERYGSLRHSFYIVPNRGSSNIYFKSIDIIKDECLIDICKNVAEYLSVGEFAMLKKSYFKSQAWFEKAKSSASLGADILHNY